METRNFIRVALTMGYFFGAVVLMALIGLFKGMRFKEMFKIYVDGMKSMTDVAVTLVLAWSLGNGIIPCSAMWWRASPAAR